MTKLVSGVILVFGMTGCSDNASNTSGAGGTTGVQSSGGTSSIGGSSATSGGGSSTGGTGTPINGCQLQGQLSANAHVLLPQATCGSSAGAYDTIYSVTISGTSITLTQTVENFPMSGTIDANCNVSIVVTTPAYREFNLVLDPNAMTATGTYITANLSDCRSTRTITMTLLRS
jgi:hypothetical protein